MTLEHLETRVVPATYIWTGAGGSANWSVGANWQGGAQPMALASTLDNLVFPSGVTALTANDNIANGVFNSISFSGSGYTITDTTNVTFTLGNSAVSGPGYGYILANSGASGDSIKIPTIALGGQTGTEQVFTVDPNATLTISSNLIGGVGLTKAGAGTLIMGGSNGHLTGPIAIQNSGGVLQITSSTALGNGLALTNTTTVGTNAQLQVNVANGSIPVGLILNGPGPDNTGALLNMNDNTTWTGNVELDSDSYIGGTVDTSNPPVPTTLTIKGVISDTGSGHNITKVGQGIIAFAGINTYRGTTTINNGILDAEDYSALGIFNGNPSAGVLVNSTLTGSGTLRLKDPSGVGFTIANEQLTLNGPGFDPTLTGNGTANLGAFDNAGANNTWTGNVTLGSPAPFGSDVSIGSESLPNNNPTNLTITGVIGDVAAPDGPFNLTKVGTGEVTFTAANTYMGSTNIADGILNIQDSQGLGPSGAKLTAANGTTVQIGGALWLSIDNIPDSFTNTINTLNVDQFLSIRGTGPAAPSPYAQTGALRSVSGINIWSGPIRLLNETVNGTLTPVKDSIGVAADPNSSSDFNYFYNDYSLTVIGTIFSADAAASTAPAGDIVLAAGIVIPQDYYSVPATPIYETTFEKDDYGQLILSGSNTYEGPTDIHKGWITVENNTSLGQEVFGVGQSRQVSVAGYTIEETDPTQDFGLGQSVQPYTTVEAGASLQIRSPQPGVNLTLPNNLNLAGNGISSTTMPPSTNFGLIEEGALENIGGDNTVTGYIQLNGQAGIGVEQIGDSNLPTSNLYLQGYMLDASSAGGGGINKLGSQRLYLQGSGTYTGSLDIQQGVVQINNNTALGLGANPATIEAGTSLEIGGTVASLDGGQQTGIQIWNTSLVVNGGGDATLGDNAALVNVSNDNLWRGTGTISLNNDASIDVAANTRLGLIETISDANNPAAGGSALTKLGVGELVLGGTSTYRGNTNISQGIVTIESNQALGAPSSATTGSVIVSNGAQLQVQGGVTVGGKTLVLQGDGVATAETTVPTWFSDGPAPVLNGKYPNGGNETLGGPVSGRMTGIAVDPTDPNVIYAATAGGALWKTIDGGNTWLPLFDRQPNPTSDTNSQLFSGAVAVDPANPRIVIFGTGEADNSGDSYYGTGVYISTDAGLTWTQVIDTYTNNNPFAGMVISKIVVDPYDPDGQVSAANPNGYPVFYVADGDQGVTEGTAVNTPGVWRYDANAPIVGKQQEPQWFDLTNVVSAARLAGGISTPGPDDLFKNFFPQTSATWSDLAIYYDTVGRGSILYAALGTPDGNLASGNDLELPTPIPFPSNAVFRLPLDQEFYAGTLNQQDNNPEFFNTGGSPVPDFYPEGPYWAPNNPINGTGFSYSNPVWFQGNGYIVDQANTPNNKPPYGSEQNINSGGGNPFPTPITTGGRVDNGTIKITVAGPAAGSAALYVGEYTTQEGFFPPDFDSPYLSTTGLTVYASVSRVDNLINNIGQPTTDQLLEVDVSTDGGLDWAQTKAQPPNYLGTQGNYDNTIQADPENPLVVFAGGQSNYTNPPNGPNYVEESLDGGVTWHDVSIDTSGNGPHTDEHAMAWDGSNLLIGGDGGIWQLIGPGSSNLWKDINGNLDTITLNGIAVSPTDPTLLFGGSQDNGTEMMNGQPAWNLVNFGDGGMPAINPNNPNIVYSTADGLLQESTQGGAANSFNTIFQDHNGLYFPYTIDPQNSNRLVVGSTDQTWFSPPFPLPQLPYTPVLVESLDGGQTWIDLSANLDVGSTPQNPAQTTPPPGGGVLSVQALALGQYQGMYQADSAFPQVGDVGANTYVPGTIYVVGSDTATGQLDLMLTKDEGQSWVNRTPAILDNEFPFPTSVSLTVDPTDENTVYLTQQIFSPGGTASNLVLESTDAGVDWTDISGNLPNLPVLCSTVDPRNGNLYVGTDDGVWLLANGSSNWTRFGTGMPNVEVTQIVLNTNLNTLTASTYGRGAFTAFLDDTTANGGALRAVSGNSSWTGKIELAGPTSIGAAGSAAGSQIEQDGQTMASINLIGTISDAPGTVLNADGSSPNTLTKVGEGDVILSGANTYAGLTEVTEGVLGVANPQGLGFAGSVPGQADTGTVVDTGASLQLFSSILPPQSTPTIAEPLTLNGNGLTFNGHYTGALENVNNGNTYSGPITLATSSVIGVDSGSALTITGTISDGGAGYNLTKEASGTLILADTNSYGGTTYVNQGAIQVESSGALSGSSTEVLDGAQVTLYSPEGGTGLTVSNEILVLSGTGIQGMGALENQSGNNTWAGPITLAAFPGFSPPTFPSGDVLINVPNPNDTLTLSGSISEQLTSGITKIGGGTLVLSGSNSYSGTTYIDKGLVTIEDPQALGQNNGNAVQRVTVAGTSGSFTLTFTHNGQTQTTQPVGVSSAGSALQSALEALSNIGTGNVSVQGTQETVSTPGVPLVTNVFTITFQGIFSGLPVPLLTVAATAPAAAQVSDVADGGIGALVSSGTALDVNLDPNNQGLSPTVVGIDLQLNGTGLNNNGTGALDNISGFNSWTGGISLASSSNIGVDGGGFNETGVVSGPTSSKLTKVGIGPLFFDAADTYGGNTEISNGILGISNSLGLGGMVTNDKQTVTLSGAGTGFFTLTFNNSTTTQQVFDTTTASSLQSALDALASIGPNGVTVTQGTGLNQNVFTIIFSGAKFAGQNQNQMTSHFGNGMTGAVVATITNGGLGGTVVDNGATLQLAGSITESTEQVSVTGNGYNGIGALDSSSGSNTWAIPLVLAGNASIGSDNTSLLTFNVPITDNGKGYSVTKVGTGTMLYTGSASNAYSGLTTVANGTLQLDDSGTASGIPGNVTVGQGVFSPDSAVLQLLANNQLLLSTVVTVNSDGLLDVNNHTQEIGSLVITDGTAQTGTGATGTLTLDSLNMTGGTLTSGGMGSNITLAGNVTATSDSNSEATITGGGTFSLGGATRTFTVVQSGAQPTDLDINTVISGISGTSNEGIVKQGNGRLELDQANTYNGTTTVMNGDLQVDGSIGNVAIAAINNAGPYDVQTLTISGPLTGSFTLSFEGYQTPAIPLNSTNLAGAIATALNGLPSIGANGVTVSQVSGTTNMYTVTFIGPTLAGQQLPLLTDTVSTGVNVSITSAGPPSLSGNGTTGIVTGSSGAVIGVVAPGDNGTTQTGILTTGSQVWGPSTAFSVDLQDATEPAGVGYDQLDVNGTINLGGAFVTGNVNPTINVGDSFVVIKTAPGGGISGNFFEPNSNSNEVFVNGPKFKVTIVNTDVVNGIFQPDNVGEVILTREVASVTMTLSSQVVTGNSSAPGNTSVYGQDYYFVAKLTSEVGAGMIPTTDSVTFTYDNSISETVNVDASGRAIFDPQVYSGLTSSVGPHTLSVQYNGDANYMTTSGSLTFTVNKASVQNLTASTFFDTTSTPQFGQPDVITAKFLAKSPGVGIPSGTAIFTVDGVYTDAVAIDPFGVATLTIPNSAIPTLPVGAHTVAVAYNGDNNFNGLTNPPTPLNINVSKDLVNLGLVASVPSAVYNEPVQFTATVASQGIATATPTGSVTFTETPAGGTPVLLGTVILTANGNGSASATLPPISSLAVGSYTITANYSGDQTYQNTGNGLTPPSPPVTLPFTVSGDQTTTTVSASANPSPPGQPVTLFATVKMVSPATGTPTGSVQFVDSTTKTNLGQPVPLNTNGVASIVVNLTAGTHTITANYLGIPNTTPPTPQTILASSGTLSEGIFNGTTTTLASLLNPATLGQTVTFTANVKSTLGTPTGSVDFFVDGVDVATKPLISGTATFGTSGLTIGGHTIVAVYDGTPSFATSTSAALTESVLISSTTKITASTSAITYGQSVTLTATVAPGSGNGTPTGSVQFYVNSAPFGSPVPLSGNDQAVLVTTTLPAGPDNVAAAYLGDAAYAPSPLSPSVSVTVNQIKTSVIATTAQNPGGLNQPISFTATVIPASPNVGAPTGSVTFTFSDGTSTMGTLVGGQATVTHTFNRIGTATVTVTYGGNGNFAGAPNSFVLTETIEKAAKVTLKSSLNPASPGSPVTFTAVVSPVVAGGITPAGQVDFIIDGTQVGGPVNLSGGKATFTTSSLPLGQHTVQAVYTGSSVYGVTSATLNESVSLASVTTMTTTSSSIVSGAPVTFTASVAPKSVNVGTPTGTASFFVNGSVKPYFTTTLDANGNAFWSPNSLPVGTDTITVKYGGDGSYGPSAYSLIERVKSPANRLVSAAFTAVSLGVPFNLTVYAYENSQVASIDNDPVRFTYSGPAGGTISGTSSMSFSNGVATFQNLVVTKGGTYTIHFFSDGLEVTVLISTFGRQL